MADYAVNGAFLGQRVTGQQRYATEISSRLPARVLAPPDGRGRLGSWAWAQSATRSLKQGELLLTLTSRGPAWSRRQVLTVHDLFVLTNPEWYSARYRATHDPVLRAQLRSAAAIVCVSEPTADRVREHTGTETPMVVAPNAPAEIFMWADIDPGRAQVEEQWGLAPGSYLLSVASEDPRKNLARLVEAYRLLPASFRGRHPLVLVGGSDSTVFATATTEVPPEVRRLGYVTDEQLAQLYAAAGLVVFPSLDEGFGLPCVEAIACGAPLLVSDVPALRWVCGDAASYMDPLDVSAMASAMELVAAAPVLPGDVRVALQQRFSWDQSAHRVHELMSGLPAGGRGS